MTPQPVQKITCDELILFVARERWQRLPNKVVPCSEARAHGFHLHNGLRNSAASEGRRIRFCKRSSPWERSASRRAINTCCPANQTDLPALPDPVLTQVMHPEEELELVRLAPKKQRIEFERILDSSVKALGQACAKFRAPLSVFRRTRPQIWRRLQRSSSRV